MFRSCILGKKLILSPPFKPSGVHIRGLIIKKRKGLLNFFTASFEDYQKSYLIPKGYQLVYVNKNIPLLNAGYFVMYFLYAGFGLTLYAKLKEGDGSSEIFGVPKEFCMLACLVFILAIQVSVTRSVRIIVMKDNEFQSIFYGFFGALRKIIVAHGPHAYLSPKNENDLFHHLQNKRIILDLDSFNDMKYYLKLVRPKESGF